MGYVCMGTDCEFAPKTDVLQYDPSTNTWTPKSNFPGGGRRLAVTFTIGNYGYLGTGYDGSNFLNDFWQYDPTGDSWTQKANFAGTARSNASGFGFNDRGYICLGDDASGPTHDIWEYNAGANSWTPKANFQGVALTNCEQFSIGGSGYVVSGSSDASSANKKELWEYDTTDVWNQRTSIPKAVEFGSGFSIGSYGYVVGGEDSSGNYLHNLWQYTPLTTGIQSTTAAQQIVIGPNPFNNQLIFNNLPVATGNTISLFNALGQCVFNNVYNTAAATVRLPDVLATGVYILQVSNSQAALAKVKLIKE